MRRTKELREIAPIASAYQFEFAGLTSKGHYRWIHKPTGFSVVSVRSTGSYHSLKNTERDFKRRLRQFTENTNG